MPPPSLSEMPTFGDEMVLAFGELGVYISFATEQKNLAPVSCLKQLWQ